MSATEIPPAPLKRILFIDESQKFLRLLVKTLPKWSAGKWELLTATTPTEAIQLMDAQRIDLVVVDPALKVSQESRFLKQIQQRHPQLRKAALIGKNDEELRRQCFQAGAEICVLRPKSRAGFNNLFTTLDQIWSLPSEGFRGLLPKVSLTDLIQLECINMRNSVLEITSGPRSGEVYIRQGKIVHAAAGSKTGVEGFIRLMQIASGEFHLKPFFEPPEHTIEMSRDQLLLEAAFCIDENLGKMRTAAGNDTHTAWFENPNLKTKSSPAEVKQAETNSASFPAEPKEKKAETPGVWNSVCSWLVGANQ